MKRPFIIHPFLFAIFPILFLYCHNIEQALFSETLLPSITALGFTLVFVLLLRLILRDGKKAAIIGSIFMVLFFSYGHVFDMIPSWQIRYFDKHKYFLAFWGVTFACGSYFVVRTRRDLHNFTKILNTAALSLAVISLINIGTYEFKTRSAPESKNKRMDIGKAATSRDIYYIILDGYANSSTLKEIYGYDNRRIIDYLTKKGFYVASASRSNYAQTQPSLASSMNMEYINYLTDLVGEASNDMTPLYQMIENSKVMNFLKSTGYMFIHFGSGWGPTKQNKYADVEFQCDRWYGGTEFIMVLVQTTMLRLFEGYLIEEPARARVLYTFYKLSKVHKIKGPKFIFVHMLPPHAPYLFGVNGERIPGTKLTMHGDVWQEKKLYLNQLIFINHKIEMLVDKILSKSKVLPIIILQADHGSASTFCDPNSGGWDQPTETNLRERMRIFNAYYLPEGGKDLLYDSITPVNTFRLIFNFYFDTNYELLDDQSYFSSYYGNRYGFVNVTAKTTF